MRKLYGLLIGMVLFCLQVAAQTKEVAGKITDSKDGAPLSGVTISVKGTAQSTVSAADGTFKMNIPESATTLQFSYVGYPTTEMQASSLMNVSLEAGDKSLTEVVVVGYGTKVRREVTSSIAKVTSKEFQNLPLPSFESALQGRASGVFINQGSGKLGQALKIRVRGISSISANQSPFVVIDGVPVVSQSLGSAGEEDNPLATLNPDDIESIEVLKDAASSAIYGARASNGVLLITTKSGKQGKTKINLGYFTGWSQPTKKAKFLNATQYKELFGYAAEHSDFGQLDPAEEFEAETGTTDWNSDYNSNWADQAFQDGRISQYTASISGGDARTKFLISGSWNDQKGIVLGNALDRGNGRVNLDHTFNSIFKIGLNLSLAKSRNYRASSDNNFTNPVQLNALPPIQPIIDPNTGKYNRNTLYYNVLIDQGATSDISTTYRSISSGYVEVTLAPKLVFRSQIGLDWNNLQEEQYLGRETLDGAPTGQGFKNDVTSSVITSTNTFNYNHNFGDKHYMDATLGTEFQTGKTGAVSSTGIGFPSDHYQKITSAAVIQSGSSTETEFSFMSYFLRANYKYNDRFLLGASFRVDGSSRFGSDNRYGAFPAVSAGYILSEENFLKNNDVLSFLKIRGSFGRTGNSEIGNFASRTLWSALPYADVAGIVASQIGASDLSWEKTNQFDAGVDFGFWGNRISGEIDYFVKKTNGLLLSVPTPAVNGFTSITKNVGDMQNKGWEFVLNANILTGELRWSVSANVSTYRNEVTRLVAPVSPGTRTLSRLAVGQPYAQFYGRKFAGADPDNGDALYYTADGKTTNDYSAAVDTIIGDPNPDYYGGVGTKLSYKGFDLDIQGQFVKGGDIYNQAGFFQSVNGDYFDNQTVDQMNYWKAPGQVTNIPEPRLYSGNGTDKSSRWIQDGSYFRVKSVNLGYNIPRKVLTRFKIENARVYVAASNLFTFTKYTGYDPEVNTGYLSNLELGHDFYTPPQIKTISVGINLGF